MIVQEKPTRLRHIVNVAPLGRFPVVRVIPRFYGSVRRTRFEDLIILKIGSDKTGSVIFQLNPHSCTTFSNPMAEKTPPGTPLQKANRLQRLEFKPRRSVPPINLLKTAERYIPRGTVGANYF